MASNADVFIPMTMVSSSSVEASHVRKRNSQGSVYLRREFHGGMPMLMRYLAA